MSRATNRGRWLFVAAAIWNVSVGLAAMLAPETMASLVYRTPLPIDNPTALAAWSDFAACVLLFGVGYAIVARDTSRNHGLVWIGIAGKLGVVAAWGYRFASGIVIPSGVVPVAIDGLFALAFLRFLFSSRGGEDARSAPTR